MSNAPVPKPAQVPPQLAKLFGYIGGRDPVEIMTATPAALWSAIDGLSDAAVRTPEAPGKWSALEVIQHLADTEMVWAVRYRLILSQDKPTVPCFDENAWANAMRYSAAAPAEAITEFEALRTANLHLFQRVAPVAWDRACTHPERGVEDLALCVHIAAGHDLCHLAQIARIRKGLGL